MDTIKEKKSNIKTASVCSANVVLRFFSLFGFGLGFALLLLLCFFFSFHMFCVLLYTLWFLSSTSAFVILHPELQLAVCACLTHSIGEEREKRRVEMGLALFLSSLVSNAFPRKVLYRW